MRAMFVPLFFAAAVATAQDTKTPPAKQDTKTAVKQDTKTAVKQDARAAPPASKQDAKVAPVTKQDTKAGAAAPAGQRRTGLNVAPETPSPKPVEILREQFDYTSGGRRDPFNSLMGTGELRPTVADLRLVGVLYHPTRPVAIMRDILPPNTQYRVTLGATLGRMKVIMIKPRVVIFSIEEFGLNRQDSLVLGDSTKVRAR
jgi:hypothetical protein